jgi:hypothetical protein
MSSLADFAARLRNASSAIDRVVVHAYGEVIGAELLQDFEDHRDSGKLADTLTVAEQRGAVDFTSQYYRQFFGRFRKGIPKATMQRARGLAQERLHALLGTSGGTTGGPSKAQRQAAQTRAKRAGGVKRAPPRVKAL